VDRAGRRTNPRGIRTYFRGFGWRSGEVSTAVLDAAGFLDGPLGLAVDGAGRYGWDGGLGTSSSADPGAGTTAILMTQRLPPSWDVLPDFSTLARATR